MNIKMSYVLSFYVVVFCFLFVFSLFFCVQINFYSFMAEILFLLIMAG